REARAGADDGAAEKAEPRMRCRQRQRVAGDDEADAQQRARARTDAVGRPPARHLHEHVHDELHRHEEQDDREADAVDMRQPRRDGADERDVPADGYADADAADAVHRARLNSGVRPRSGSDPEETGAWPRTGPGPGCELLPLQDDDGNLPISPLGVLVVMRPDLVHLPPQPIALIALRRARAGAELIAEDLHVDLGILAEVAGPARIGGR